MECEHGHLTDGARQVYHRHITLREIGEAGQLRLLHSRVLIIGAGGLGSSAAYYLSAAGVGTLGIADNDRVEPSNLQRQILHGQCDVGKKKTLSAAEKLPHLRPNLRLNLHPVHIDRDNGREIIKPYDFVIEATDNFPSKFLINDICVQLRKPFSHAGVSAFFGQTMTVVPGKGPCFRCIFEDPPQSGAVAEEPGILSTVPGVIGLIQATEAIKSLLGCGSLLVGRILSWDALAMTFREISLPVDKPCNICREVPNQ
jgi:molybdopterin-synthase adenylyltransferase